MVSARPGRRQTRHAHGRGAARGAIPRGGSLDGVWQRHGGSAKEGTKRRALTRETRARCPSHGSATWPMVSRPCRAPERARPTPRLPHQKQVRQEHHGPMAGGRVLLWPVRTLAVDRADVLLVGDHQSRQLLGTMTSLRLVGEQTAQLLEGLLNHDWKRDDGRDGWTLWGPQEPPDIIGSPAVAPLTNPTCQEAKSVHRPWHRTAPAGSEPNGGGGNRTPVPR